MPIERLAPPAPGASDGARSATGGAPGAAPQPVFRNEEELRRAGADFVDR
ncbi:MAG: hypothetical protein Q8N51_01115 [Gammaproteobacteria bacterium]|nr:hypothetical protein [Gammaproteobacteria bacterium]